MASFDIQSKMDMQLLDNAVNTINKEIQNRYDFKGTHFNLDWDKKANKLNLEVESEMKLDQAIDVILSKCNKQGLDLNGFDFSKEHYASGKIIKKEIAIKNGLDQTDAKKVVKLIKDSGLKVQTAIMDEMVRVTGKKIDDLQDVIQLCNSKSAEIKIPMQYLNMKS